MKNRLYSFFAGSLYPFGFAPFDFWPLTLLSLLSLLVLLKDTPLKDSLILGFLYGIGLWSVGVSWVFVSIYYHGNTSIIIALLITLLFILFLSLYNLLFTFMFKKLSIGNNLDILLAFPFSWVLVEFLRSYLFTGFPWMILGTSISSTRIDGWIAVLGVYGNSYLLLILVSLIFLVCKGIQVKKSFFYSFLSLIFLLSTCLILDEVSWTKLKGKASVTIVQPNLSIEEKWSLEGLSKTKLLIEETILQAKESEIVFFPETAIILDEERNKAWLNKIDQIASERKVSLISGIVGINKETKEFTNRVKGYGLAEGYYDKIHLVPFGEYIPFVKVLGKLLRIFKIYIGETKGGESFSFIKVEELRISPTICYEIAFNNLVRKSAIKGNLLLTISNDTWFGKSIGPNQHNEIAQSRAAEHQKTLIRSTNSGISSIIKEDGKIIDKIKRFEDKVIKHEVDILEGRTPFSIYGNIPIYLILLVSLSVLIILKRTNVLKS